MPICFSPAVTGDAGVRPKTLIGDRNHAGAGDAAMLHARHHLLADEAALVEVDAVELVHVGLVRERIAIDEVEAAARHAERDAVRLVVRGIDQRGAEIVGGLFRQVRRQHDARAPARAGRGSR